jgi:hypothetical protein
MNSTFGIGIYDRLNFPRRISKKITPNHVRLSGKEKGVSSEGVHLAASIHCLPESWFPQLSPTHGLDPRDHPTIYATRRFKSQLYLQSTTNQKSCILFFFSISFFNKFSSNQNARRTSPIPSNPL